MLLPFLPAHTILPARRFRNRLPCPCASSVDVVVRSHAAGVVGVVVEIDQIRGIVIAFDRCKGNGPDMELSSSLNLDAVCAEVAHYFNVDAAGIALLRRSLIRYVAGYGFQWHRVPPLRVGESLLGRLLSQTDPLVSSDLRTDPRCSTSDEARKIGVGGFLGCVLRDAQGRAFGAVTLLQHGAIHWKEPHVAGIESMAAILSLFLLAGKRGSLTGTTSLTPCFTTPTVPKAVIESPSMKALVERSQRYATTGRAILILGERGTGKDLLARWIHAASDRTGEFVAINCASIPTDLIESELFGHARGSFTGASRERIGAFRTAHKGTLFLDEVAELTRHAQAKLLTTVEDRHVRMMGEDRTRQVDVRIIAATNVDIRPGRGHGFREDLYDRIAECVLVVPPLRERPEDLRAMICRFLEDITSEMQHPVRVLSSEAFARLTSYSWPGNVRELKRVLRAAVLDTAPGEEVSGSILDFQVRMQSEPSGMRESTPSLHQPGSVPTGSKTGGSLRPAPRGGQRDEQLVLLHRNHGGNSSKIAREVGMARQNVRARLRRLGLR